MLFYNLSQKLTWWGARYAEGKRADRKKKTGELAATLNDNMDGMEEDGMGTDIE